MTKIDSANVVNADAVVEEANESFNEASELVEEEETQLNLLLSTWIELLKKVETSIEVLGGFLGSRLEIDLSQSNQATIDPNLSVMA